MAKTYNKVIDSFNSGGIEKTKPNDLFDAETTRRYTFSVAIPVPVYGVDSAGAGNRVRVVLAWLNPGLPVQVVDSIAYDQRAIAGLGQAVFSDETRFASARDSPIHWMN